MKRLGRIEHEFWKESLRVIVGSRRALECQVLLRLRTFAARVGAGAFCWIARVTMLVGRVGMAVRISRISNSALPGEDRVDLADAGAEGRSQERQDKRSRTQHDRSM